MNTLFDKIWDAHVVQKVEDGPTQLYIEMCIRDRCRGRQFNSAWDYDIVLVISRGDSRHINH